jgi:hypothetical protein
VSHESETKVSDTVVLDVRVLEQPAKLSQLPKEMGEFRLKDAVGYTVTFVPHVYV